MGVHLRFALHGWEHEFCAMKCVCVLYHVYFENNLHCSLAFWAARRATEEAFNIILTALWRIGMWGVDAYFVWRMLQRLTKTEPSMRPTWSALYSASLSSLSLSLFLSLMEPKDRRARRKIDILRTLAIANLMHVHSQRFWDILLDVRIMCGIGWDVATTKRFNYVDSQICYAIGALHGFGSIRNHIY